MKKIMIALAFGIFMISELNADVRFENSLKDSIQIVVTTKKRGRPTPSTKEYVLQPGPDSRLDIDTKGATEIIVKNLKNQKSTTYKNKEELERYEIGILTVKEGRVFGDPYLYDTQAKRELNK